MPRPCSRACGCCARSRGRRSCVASARWASASSPEALHALRRRARRLRYAAEIEDTVRGDDTRAPSLWKRLQDSIGVIHDHHVLASWLEEQARAAARARRRAPGAGGAARAARLPRHGAAAAPRAARDEAGGPRAARPDGDGPRPLDPRRGKETPHEAARGSSRDRGAPRHGGYRRQRPSAHARGRAQVPGGRAGSRADPRPPGGPAHEPVAARPADRRDRRRRLGRSRPRNRRPRSRADRSRRRRRSWTSIRRTRRWRSSGTSPGCRSSSPTCWGRARPSAWPSRRAARRFVDVPGRLAQGGSLVWYLPPKLLRKLG